MVGLTAPFIVVTGTIGAGKSTLVRRLAKGLGVPAFPEQAKDNPFFGAPDEQALKSELWFLNEAIAAFRTASGRDGGVVERAPAEHLEIFARHRRDKGWITSAELELLETTYAASGQLARNPNLLVHLELSQEEALQRVRLRGREGEQALDLEYLAALEPLYESLVQRWSDCPVLRIYTDRLDYRDADAFELVLSDVQARLNLHLPMRLQGGEVPGRAYPGDAGLDLPSAIDAEIEPLARLEVPTGIAIRIPEGHVGLIVPRSGYASKHGITHLDGPGIIDSGYRDQVHLLLYNTDKNKTFKFKAGDKLGQLVIVPFAHLDPFLVNALTPSVRQHKGLGSSTNDLPARD